MYLRSKIINSKMCIEIYEIIFMEIRFNPLANKTQSTYHLTINWVVEKIKL